MRYDKINEPIIGNSLGDGMELMSHILTGCHNFLWRNLMVSGKLVNPIFCITFILFVEGIQRDLCGGLEYRTTGINKKQPQW